MPFVSNIFFLYDPHYSLIRSFLVPQAACNYCRCRLYTHKEMSMKTDLLQNLSMQEASAHSCQPVYLPFWKVIGSFCGLISLFTLTPTESEDDPIRVIGIVVVVVTIAVHVPEIRSVGIVSRTKPPVVSRATLVNNLNYLIIYNYLYLFTYFSRSRLIAFVSSISSLRINFNKLISSSVVICFVFPVFSS